MKYANLPEKIDLDFYKKCRQEFLQICRKNPDIVAVYEAGSVSVPGISDLDFIVCVSDNPKNDLNIEEKLSHNLKRIIGGGNILKVNDSDFQSIRMIDDFSMSFIRGERFKFNNFASKTFDICRIIDWLAERLYSLLRVKNSKSINVINGLQIMKSATISLRKLDEISGNKNYGKFINKISNLRKGWFKNKNRIKSFQKLMAESIKIYISALNFLDRYLLENNYISGINGKDCRDVVFGIKSGPKFLFSNKAFVNKKNEIFLPASFFYFFAAQAILGKGIISDNLKKSFNKRLKNTDIKKRFRNDLRETIKRRIDYCNNLASFFRENNIKKGLLKYGWFLQ